MRANQNPKTGREHNPGSFSRFVPHEDCKMTELNMHTSIYRIHSQRKPSTVDDTINHPPRPGDTIRALENIINGGGFLCVCGGYLLCPGDRVQAVRTAIEGGVITRWYLYLRYPWSTTCVVYLRSYDTYVGVLQRFSPQRPIRRHSAPRSIPRETRETTSILCPRDTYRSGRE